MRLGNAKFVLMSSFDVDLFVAALAPDTRCFSLFCCIYNAVSWFIFCSMTKCVHLVLHSTGILKPLFVYFAAKKTSLTCCFQTLFSRLVFLSSIIFVVSIHITLLSTRASLSVVSSKQVLSSSRKTKCLLNS
jgi:hypothetical protein